VHYSEKIGIPVVETVAIEKRGFKKLLQHLRAGPVVPEITVRYPEAVEKGIEELLNILPDTNINKRAVAVMLLADQDETRSGLSVFIGSGAVAAARIITEKVQKQFSQPLGYIIGVSRSKTVDRLLDTVFMKDIQELGLAARAGMRKRQAFTALGLTAVSLVLYSFLGHEILANWGLHPFLLHVVALIFLFTVLPYAILEKLTTHYIIGAFFLMEVLYLMYKFVGVFGAGTLVNFIENNFFKAAVVPAAVSIIEKTVPGVFFRDLLVGDYGLISMGLTYSIAIVMPIVATFFFAFGILEDSGYLPRLSVIADRIMRRVGLNGKAVLPMVLGLGCATMATLTARILDTRKERVIATLLLALGIPCSAQLGVIIAVVSQCSAAVTLTVVLVVLAQLLIVGTLSAKLIKSRAGDFIVELPPLRPPQLLNIILKTTHRMKWFLIEAVPLFLAGTLILFFIDRIGGLVWLERAFSPVIRGMLGLPEDSAFAFIVGFFRRDYGAAGLYDLFSTGRLNHNQVAVSMVVITLFVPCIANLLVMIKERGSGTAFAMAAFILPYAVLVGTALNYFLRLHRP